jgi:hypothetical protein
MKALERMALLSVLAAPFVAPACESAHVPDWSYVVEAQDAGASSDGASEDADGGEQGGQSAPPADPLACDGALCDTTNYNYTGCDVARSPHESGAVPSLSALVLVAAMVWVRSRARRKRERTP